MKRERIFKTLCIVAVIVGILATLVGAILAFFSLPAYKAVITGDTALQFITQDETLGLSFLMAGLNTYFMINGLLILFCGITGLAGLKTHKLDNCEFLCGTICFLQLFEIVGNLSDVSDLGNLANCFISLAFFLLCRLLAQSIENKWGASLPEQEQRPTTEVQTA